MALIKYDPLRELNSLARRFDSLFEDMRPSVFEGNNQQMFAPRVDISEDEKNIYIEAELAGMKRDDVKISVSDENILTIRGEKRYEHRWGNENQNGNGNEGKSESKSNGKNKEKNSDSEQNQAIQTQASQTIQQGNQRNYHRIERSYGSFTRSFTLPENADGEKISAKFNDGVLEIVIPKKQPTRPKEVNINIE